MPCYCESDKEELDKDARSEAILCALTKYIEGIGHLDGAHKYVYDREKLSLRDWMAEHKYEDKIKKIRTHKVD